MSPVLTVVNFYEQALRGEGKNVYGAKFRMRGARAISCSRPLILAQSTASSIVIRFGNLVDPGRLVLDTRLALLLSVGWLVG